MIPGIIRSMICLAYIKAHCSMPQASSNFLPELASSFSDSVVDEKENKGVFPVLVVEEKRLGWGGQSLKLQCPHAWLASFLRQCFSWLLQLG